MRHILSTQAAALPRDLKPQPGCAQVCIARHGETDWNAAGILQGWIDTRLNARGREQALELAAALATADFARIYSSPLSRAWESAEIIAAKLKLPAPVALEGVKERGFGAIQGIPKAELAELNPQLLQQILTRNPAASFEQGETMDEFADRVLAATLSIARTSPEQRVLLITHGWVLDVITREINHVPRHTILNHKPKNSECLWLEVSEQSIRHLEA